MSGIRPFVRQLGQQPGVQLNKLIDQTDGVGQDQSDQSFAVCARLSRGRIDRPFVVDRSTFLALTGPAETIRANALNEAKLQTYEALNNGAASAVVMRMTHTDAAMKFAIVDMSADTTVFGVSAAATPASGTWSLSIADYECHNDGLIVSVHADTKTVGGIPAVNDVLTLNLYSADGDLRYSFTGSVNPLAKDDYGQTAYLPDIVASFTDNIVVQVNTAFAGVATTSDAYGRDQANKDKAATSSALVCFTEGTTVYAAADYDRFIDGLRQTQYSFGYIITGGSQVASFVAKLASFAFETNTHLRVDVPGKFTPAEAIAFVTSVGLSTSYAAYFWAPLSADDPMNGGKAVFGAAGLNVGFSCYRNSQTNGDGFAPKNQPIAGKAYLLNRSGVKQLYTPSDAELSDLAKAKINPVIFQTYSSGSGYAFTDCLTTLQTQVSSLKLTSVAEMAGSVDGAVAAAAKEYSLLPMETFIKKMDKFLDTLLGGAYTAQWLKKSKNLPGNAPFQYDVVPDATSPSDTVSVTYWDCYDGVARKVKLQQILSR